MLSFNFGRWLKGWVRQPRGKTIVKRKKLRLAFEELESRITPAFVWQGGSGANWSVGANWVGGIAPSTGAVVDLTFGNTAASFTSNDDINGLTVGQITIAGNYTLTKSAGVTMNFGNPSTLTGQIIVNTGVVASSSIDVVLGNAATSTEFINVQTGASLTWNGRISGFSTAQLTKLGAGTLILGGDNSGFTGPFKIDNSLGNGVVSITNADALGGPITAELQTFTINGANGTSRFAFTYPTGTNPTTPDITFTGAATDAGSIQSALNTLFNGLGFTGAPVTVRRIASSAGSGTFTIAFGGSMANVNALTLLANVTAGPGTATMSSLADGGNPNLVTISTNTQLQLNITTGSHLIDNPLSLNGAGPNGNSGALFNVAGNNEWAGSIQMNATTGTSNTTFGVANAAETLQISGQISNAGLSGYTLTKQGLGVLYLNPQHFAGNTFAGNTIVNGGELSIGHPFALGPGGARTIVNSSAVESGSLTLNYSGNAFIPAQYLHFAQVQTLSFSGAAPGTTRFTLSYNGETTAPITLDTSPAGAAAIETALNNLPTILNIQANVSVVRVGSEFRITFGGSLGGMEIPTINSAITAGPGSVAIGVVSGTTPIGFQVPNQFLTLNGPGKAGIFVSPRTGLQSTPQALNAPEVTGALNNQAGHNSWEQTITFWSTATSPLPISNYYAPAVTIGAVRNTNLTINAKIIDNGVFFTTLYSFSKVGHGRLILTAANEFPVYDDVLQGALNIRDSNALGLDAGIFGGVEAWNGTSIELQADGIPDSIGAAGTYNLFFPPTVPFWLNGPGLNNQGALYNMSGSNKILGSVFLRSGASIGVAPDPDPFNIQGHTNNNLSQLTIDGLMSSLVPNTNTPLAKVGHGELVLTNANTYTVTITGRYPTVNAPQTHIRQGWITAENNFALGGRISTTDAVNPPVSIDAGAALVLKKDLNGNDLVFPYNIIVRGTGINHRSPWLHQKGALLNLSGTNTVAGYMYLEGDAGIGVELDGSNVPNPAVSQMILSGIGSSGATIMDGAAPGKLLKLGSQRLVIANPGTYTGGHDIIEGVVRIENDTALGTGSPSNPVTTIINSGTALEIGPTVAQLNGGIERGLQIYHNHLILNGTGNATFGVAPLVILSDDNIWRGPITLHSNVAITFRNQLANMALPNMVANSTALLGGGSIRVNTTTPGSSGIAAVQTLSFDGTITGGTFTLTLSDGAGTSAVTGPITWNASVPVLLSNIQQALDAIATAWNGVSIAAATRNSPTIYVAPNARFNVTGVIDDGGGVSVGSNPLIHDYQFNGTFADLLGGPAMVPTGGTLGATRYFWNRVVGANEGLTLTGALPALDNYSIQLLFNFTSVPPIATTGYNRIIDFRNRTTDNGLYENGLRLNPFPGTNGPDDVFAPGVDVNVVITRDGVTGQVFVYANGVPQINLIDPNGPTSEYTSTGELLFFIDDLIVRDEVSGGSLDFVKIYNRPLTATEVLIVTAGGTLGASASAATGDPADMSVAGGGELVLSGANTYRGVTNVNQGILTISNNAALGAGAAAEKQTLTFTTADTVYNLSFGTATTPNLTFTGLAGDLANITSALNALPTIGGVGGTATVTQSGNVFTVELGGTLAGFDQVPIVATVIGPGSINVNTLADGAGGTKVANGAQLQMQGGITVSNEPVILQGQGNGPTAEVQSITIAGGNNGAFNISFTNPNTALTSFSTALPVGASALQVQAALNQMASILQGSGLGGGSVKVSQSGSGVYSVQFGGSFVGATNLPTLGVNPVAEQIVSITGSSGSFTLNFTGTPGLTTVPLAPDVRASGGTTPAASIENALNALLANPGAPGGGAGTAMVLATTSTGIFIVTFGGSLANVAVPNLVADNFTGNTFATVTALNSATGFAAKIIQGGSPIAIPTQWFQIGPAPINNGQIFNGGTAPNADVTGRVTGILSDPNDANIVYISTAGGGAWKTINGGQSWTPLFDGVSAVQSVRLTSKTGTFTLTFRNPLTGITSTTPVLAYNASADQVESALNGLPSVGGAGGSVRVLSVSTGGVDEIQELDLSVGMAVPGMTRFTITFGGSTTAPILYTGTSADAATIANALNSAAFASIGGIGGVVQVSTPATGVFNIRFGGTLAQQPQPFAITSAITAGPPYVPSVTVTTPGALPFVTYGITFSGGTLRNLPLIATGTPSLTALGSGGAVAAVSMIANGLSTSAVMYTGAIAMARTDSRILYLGGGETTNSFASFYGSGVYVTKDYGQTWSLLVDSNGNNPLAGQAVSKIVVDPNNPNLIYVASADRAINSHDANGNPLVGVVGIWRYNAAGGGSWTNLTALAFPSTTTNFSWSDVALGLNGNRLFAAAGKNSGDAANGVYVTTSDPRVGIPTWSTNLLNLAPTTPNAPNSNPQGSFGVIKISVVPNSNNAYFAISTAEVNGTAGLNSIAFYRDIDAASGNVPTTTVVAFPAALIPDYLRPQGSYDTAIVTLNATTFYVGGVDPGTGDRFVLRGNTPTGEESSFTFTDLSVFAGEGPHTDIQALSLDRFNNLLVGSGGGVWRLDTASSDWSNLNGNLAITQINGIATPSNNIDAALIGAQDTGTSAYSGSQNWTQTDGGDGGIVLYDPNNPNVVYHDFNGNLRVSTNGGASWITVFNTNFQFFPFAISSLQSAPNTSVLFVASRSPVLDVYRFTYNYATNTLTRLALNAPAIQATALAISTNQGPFTPDPAFPGVVDVGANSPDPNTVYITDGTDIYVTKNLGITWNALPRNPLLTGNVGFRDLLVDPTNRDHVYAVTGGFGGGEGFTGSPGVGRVFESFNAGQTWTDISAGLPDSPGWKLVIDPRNGDLYLGNDVGVYLLKGGAISGTNLWTRFGAGMPYVSVHTLEINPTLNTLTAGTYGRSAYQFYLDSASVDSGALRAAAGSDIWNGPVILAGNATISTQGNQEFHNGLAVAQLTILGTISDLTPNTTTNTLTKTGSGDVILAGNGTYGGHTIVQQGNLVIQNPTALGSPGQGTTVLEGAVLQLSTSLSQEPLNLFGNGAQKSGHFTGALENVSNNNTYDGVITLQSNATIGVDTGSSLTIVAPGTITDGLNTFSLTKEGIGTFIVATDNSYGGGTFVNQGVLNIRNNTALGSAGGTTTVVDGAQLQLEAPAGSSLSITTQNLSLTGSGIGGAGALYNVSGNNTWGSLGTTVTLNVVQSFAPQSLPNGIVTIGVANAADTLVIDSPIGETNAQTQGTPFSPPGPVMTQSMGLAKAGPGAAILTRANTYSGTTYVNQGTLNIQDSNSLGNYAGRAVQRITISDALPTDTFTLTFKGVPTAAIPIGETANNFQSALTNLSSIGGGGVHVGRSIVYSGINEVQTLTFNSVLAGTTQYTLTFNGATTIPLTFTGTGSVDALTIANALDSITASGNFTVIPDASGTSFAIHFGGTLQKSLQALIKVQIVTSPGSATVAQTIAGSGRPNYVYTVEFTGAALTGPQPLITVTGSSSQITSTVTTVSDGSAGVIVSSGATLGLSGGINVPAAQTITLNGAGVNNLGALRNISGANTWNSVITMASSSSIGADAGSTLNVTGNIRNPNPAPVPPAPIAPPTLTKVGTGTVALVNGNTYTGNTNISAGILNIQNAQSLGINTSAVQTITVSGTSGTFTLFFTGFSSGVSTGPISVAGLSAATLASAINAMLANPSAPGGGAGTVTVVQEASGNVYDVTFGGSLAGIGVPMLIAPTGNFTGSAQASTTLILAGGASQTTVLSGATLQLQSVAGFSESSGKTLVLNGLGFNGIGAFDNLQGNNTWAATPILLASDASIGSDADRLTVNQKISDQFQSQVLTFNGFNAGNAYNLSFAGLTTGTLFFNFFAAANASAIQNALNALPTVSLNGGNVVVTSLSGGQYRIDFKGPMAGAAWPLISPTRITGTGSFSPVTASMTNANFGVTKPGAGIVQYAGSLSNAYTGLTNVINGTLELNKAGTDAAILGNLNVGDNMPAVNEVQTITLNGAATTGTQFTLSFGAQTTAPINYTDDAAAAVAAALTALTNIGANNVSVTQLGNAFTITFINALAAANQDQITGNIVVGADSATSATPAEGAPPTFAPFAANSDVVRLLADNQISNGAVVTVKGDGLFDLDGHTETIQDLSIFAGTASTGPTAGNLTVTGAVNIVDGTLSASGLGAIVNLGDSLSMTGGAIVLGNATSQLIAKPTGTTLNATSDVITGAAKINGPGAFTFGTLTPTFTVADGPAATDLFVDAILAGTANPGLVKAGAGRMEVAVQNTYTGVTRIDQGDLQVDTLNRETVTLTGFSSGDTFNLIYSNGVQGGTTSDITYTGVPSTDASSIQNALVTLLNLLNITGGVTVTPFGTNLFDILFNGDTALNLQPLRAGVVSSAGTVATAGAPTIGNVVLNGSTPNSASVSGKGTVGTITMQNGSTTGTVTPGNNGTTKTGTLQTNGNVAWTNNGAFYVEVGNASGTHPNPVAGSDYDQLYVNGTATLGNALLSGNVLGSGMQIGDQFVILRANSVIGRFDGIIGGTRAQINNGGTVFLNGQKFVVNYFSDRVVLTRQFAALASLSFSSSANPSTYGQEVFITVTAVAEPGASFATSNGSITFTLDGFFTQVVPIASFGAQTTATATFLPQNYSGLVWAPGSSHIITAAFADANNVFTVQSAIASPASVTPTLPTQLMQVVSQNTVTITPSSNPDVTPTTPVYGETVILTASLLPAVNADVAGASNPTGDVRFVINPGSGSPLVITSQIVYVAPNSPVTAMATILGTQFLTPGSHIVHMTYLGDVNYAASTTPIVFELIIQKDNAVVTFTPAPIPTNLDQTATFFVTVAPAHAGSTGQPIGTLDFYNGSTANPALNSSPIVYTGGTVSFATSALTVGDHNIIAVFTPSSGNYNASQGSTPFTVNKATTLTVIDSVTPTTPTFGQQVTFNIQVTQNPPISPNYGLPTGTVTLYDGAVLPANIIGTGLINSFTGQVSILTATTGLSVGTHTINAVYSGDATYATSTGTIGSLVIQSASTTTTVTAVPAGSASFGSTVRFNAQVASLVGTPSLGSHVTFWDGAVGTGVNLGTATLDATGLAFIDVNTLTAGTHTINAVYTDDVNFNFNDSTGTLTGFSINNAPTDTALTTNPSVPSGTGVYGQPITLEALVTSPGGTVAVGLVTFLDGANIIGTGAVGAGGIATLTVNTLTATSHNLSAVYTDSTSTFTTSTGTLSAYVVGAASTQILAADFTSSTPISAQGSPVTFTAKVTVQSPSTINVTSGNVTFWLGGVGTGIDLGAGAVNSSGVATLTISSLPLGDLTINAVYGNGSPNYLASTSPSLTQIVRRATTITFNPFTAPNNFFGQTLDYTVSVAPAGATPPALPTGTLTISEINGTATTTLVTLNGYAGGTVQMPVIGLSAGAHTLVFNYSGDLEFAPSSKTITQVIVAARTTTTLDPLTPTSFGNPVTFIARITSTTAPNPTNGTVTFRDTYNGVTTTLATITLNGIDNFVQFPTSPTQLRAGNHLIVAIYNNTGNPDYASSPASLPRTQVVSAATTQTTLDPLNPSFFGNAVTFRATVSITSPGSLSFPTGGTVTFRKTTGGTTTLLGTVAINASGVATLTTAPTGLVVGNHTIRATYNGIALNFAASTAAPATQTVNKAGVAIAITPSIASGTITYGKTVAFTALVSNATGGAPGRPVGTVRFWDGAIGGKLLRSVALVAVNANTSRAAFATTATQLTAGAHNIIAEYLGDARHAPAMQSIPYDVNLATTATMLTSSPQFWPLGGLTTFTATVTPTSGGAPGAPTGTVTFILDGVPQTPVTLVGGKAKFGFTGFTTPTDHTVSVVYTPATAPAQNFQDSSSPVQTQTVRTASAVTFTSTSNIQGVTLRATVTGVGGPPTGTVTFYKNGVELGTATVNASGVATIFLPLGTGTHAITAVYSGDANFNPATRTRAIAGKLIGRLV